MRFRPRPVASSMPLALALSQEVRLTRTSRVLVAVVVSMLFVSTARAQDAATGVVIGRATDASGAPLAGARVVATRTATASVRETTTDSAGRYVLASLAPGEYRVSIEAPGFVSKTLDRVVVEVGRRVPADAVLERRRARRGGDRGGARGARWPRAARSWAASSRRASSIASP